ncbi:MAG: tRNA (guanosine(46)-N7)-methyltransferase TrmB [Mycobacteriales bacterium]
MRAGEEIQSFKVRRGRTGPTSVAARERLWPRYGIDPPYGDLRRTLPLVLEIGFGMGEATAVMAAARPDLDVVGVEVHPAGVAALLRRVEAADLTNVRVVDGDAVEVLRAQPAGSLAEVRVFFPDPWPKARHAKRRLLRPSFAELVHDRLGPGGFLHLATDWPAYAEHALEALAEHFDAAVVERPQDRPVTGYERRALAAGRPPLDIVAHPR